MVTDSLDTVRGGWEQISEQRDTIVRFQTGENADPASCVSTSELARDDCHIRWIQDSLDTGRGDWGRQARSATHRVGSSKASDGVSVRDLMYTRIARARDEPS